MPAFGGGGEPCVLCQKTVYPAEKISTTTGNVYHQKCFRCTQCNRMLQLSSYCEDAGTARLYCKPHYSQLAAAAGLEGLTGQLDPNATKLVEKTKKKELEDEVELLEAGKPCWVELGHDATRQFAAKAAKGEPFVRGTVAAVQGEGSIKVKVKGSEAVVPQALVTHTDLGGIKVNNLQLLHLNEAK